jgi:hypothetical protein
MTSGLFRAAIALLLFVPIVTARADGPPRPSGVPTSAIFSGGSDGGVFLTLEPLAPGGREFRARIWDANSGRLEYAGRLVARDAPQQPFEISDPRSFNGWDGYELYLSGGGSLEAVDRKK